MPAAATLDEAKSFALQNVWARVGAAEVLKDILVNQWLAVFDILTIESTVFLWQVPTSYAISQLPDLAVDQTEEDISLVIEIISRTIERFQVEGLTAGQITSFLTIYNAAWT